MIVRPRHIDPDAAQWRRQLIALQSSATALTGNDCRVLEVEDPAASRIRGLHGVFRDVANEGIDLFGSLSSFRHVSHARKRKR